MHILRSRQSSERGAVVIQVAVCLLGLLAFTTFVVDYGVMWASRGQAQTAADAGALAGAVSLAFESSTDLANAQMKARLVARQNPVFGEAPDVQLADITFPACPPGAPGPPDACVTVDVFRNQRPGGSPLPMFFGNVVGISDQGVRATATAQIVTADTTDCLKPWAIVDRWDEYAVGQAGYPNPDLDFLPTSTFDKYSNGRGGSPPQEDDLYVAPTAAAVGTGFRLPADEGLRYAVKVGDASNSVSSGWFRALDLPRADGGGGGSSYRDNIETCSGLPSSYAAPETVCPVTIALADRAYWAARGCYSVETGNKVGPTKQGIEALIARDPGASWNPSLKTVTGSAFSPQTKSPRVVPIGVMNIDLYMAQNPNGSTPVVRMENIYGLFVEGMGTVAADGSITLSSSGQSVIGRIMTIPATGSSKVNTAASFMRSVILVR
jgi:hypothetical protein